jgi:hypothetical protein
VEWSVTSLLQAEYDGSTNNGFLIRDASEGQAGFEQQFFSREKGEFPPELVIVFSAVPTPTNTAPPPTATLPPTATPLPTCTATTVTVSANADAWIEQNSPSNNKGSDSTLKVISKGPSDNTRALVNFALPSVPPACVIQSATLRLYSSSAASGRTIEAVQLAANWAENSVTWENQPATTGAAATTASGNGYLEWNVSSQVQAMYSGANNGFLIRDAVEGNSGAEQQFNSREKGSDMPQLVIVFGPAP